MCNSRGSTLTGRPPRTSRSVSFPHTKVSERDGLPKLCINTVTHRLRHGLHAIGTAVRFDFGVIIRCKNCFLIVSCSQPVHPARLQKSRGSAHFGKTISNRTPFSFRPSRITAWPSRNLTCGFGAVSDFVQITRAAQNLRVSSFQTPKPRME